jgi:hypothetical protein
MKIVMHIDGKPVTMVFKNFEDDLDLDKLTSIDYSNLYGEAVTVPALMNQVGILKAEAEKIYASKKMELEVFEAELRQRIRKEATTTAQKITENGVNESVEIDKGYQIKKKNMINSKYNLDVMDSLFWAISAKDKKLNNLVKGVTPSELIEELHEGTINNILIKKHKSIVDK